jgi:hypothetical protein
LLVWDKGNDTGSFLVLFPCMCVCVCMCVCYTPNWLYLSAFYLSSFLMVVSTSLRFLYSFLYRD